MNLVDKWKGAIDKSVVVHFKWICLRHLAAFHTQERGYFTKFSVAGFGMRKKFGRNLDGFVKMRGLKSMKKEVNWIENQGENWYKKLKICYILVKN